jgi:hypothetical protein
MVKTAKIIISEKVNRLFYFKYEREGDVDSMAALYRRNCLKRTEPNVMILRQERWFVYELKMALLPSGNLTSYHLNNPRVISYKKRKWCEVCNIDFHLSPLSNKMHINRERSTKECRIIERHREVSIRQF